MSSFYYASQKMQSVIAHLKSLGLVITLTNGKRGRDGLCEFEHGQFLKFSRDETVDVLDCSDFNRMRATIRHSFNSLSLHDIKDFVEDHSRHTTEWLDVHKAIVQIAIAHGSSLTSEDRSLVLHGNFPRIGYLEGGVVIHGNVDVLEGRISNFLTIHGNVDSLGVGPFWAQNHVSGDSECNLTIYGDVVGYKTGINNPLLTINIYGNVTNPNAFLYHGSVFKAMRIHGSLNTKKSILPGFYKGDLHIFGKAPYLVDYLKNGYMGSSASMDGEGYVWLNEVPVLINGKPHLS